MIANFHFLRPVCLLLLLPLLVSFFLIKRQAPVLTAWQKVCDPQLLPYLIQKHHLAKHFLPYILLSLSALCMIIALAGPTWSRLPVPTYHRAQPHILVLDMSSNMLEQDIAPDRLMRAKFKLHDLLQYGDLGQFGLVIYTSEPFVVSPLTEDAKTIDELLTALTPKIMPVNGNRLDRALHEAGELLKQTGNVGQILVFTGQIPTDASITKAKQLSQAGIQVSVMPMLSPKFRQPAFQQLAHAGKGLVIPFSETKTNFKPWLHASESNNLFSINMQQDIPVWRDQGRWFIIPALLLLLPAFQRGWLQRIRL